MQVRTIRFRPMRTETRREMHLPRLDNAAELSITGGIVAVIEFTDEGHVGPIHWAVELRPADRKQVQELAKAYGEMLAHIDPSKLNFAQVG